MPALMSRNKSTSSSGLPRVFLGHEGHEAAADNEHEDEELMTSALEREIEQQ